MRIILALAMLFGGAGWLMRTAEAVSIPDSVSIPVQVTRDSYNTAHRLCETYMHDKEAGYFGMVRLELIPKGRQIVLPCSVVAGK